MMIPGFIHLIRGPRSIEGKQLLKKNLTLQKNIEKLIPVLVFLIFYHLQKTDDDENSSPESQNNISHLSVLSQAKDYIRANLAKLSENNLLNCAEEFLKALTFSDSDRMSINKATVGQHKNKVWHEMRHLLVTSKKNESTLYKTKNFRNKSFY